MRPTKQQINLSGRAPRSELAVVPNTYWHALDRRAQLGYLKTKTQGIWIARFIRGRRDYVDQRVGLADDTEAADGVEILTFEQAERSAWNWYAEQIIKQANEPIDDRPFNTVGPACGRI